MSRFPNFFVPHEPQELNKGVLKTQLLTTTQLPWSPFKMNLATGKLRQESHEFDVKMGLHRETVQKTKDFLKKRGKKGR